MIAKQRQLEEIRKGNAEFLQHNPNTPQLVPQFRDIYMVKLLEHLIGDDLIDLQIEHEQWIADQVGNIKLAQARAIIQAPMNGQNPIASFPIHQGRVTKGRDR